MNIKSAALPGLFAALLAAGPALGASVTVTSGPNGTVIVNGKPCRVVTTDSNGQGSNAATNSKTNSTSITAGPQGLSGSTSVSPGGNSVTVGSGSSSSAAVAGSDGAQSSSAAGSDCVIYMKKQ